MDEKTPPSATESNLDTVKQKLDSLAEKAKQHDFKGDARKAAEGVKDLRDSLKKHDFKTELKDAFAEARKSPASLWKKPETPRPGKELAVVGFAAAVGSFLITAVTSSSFLGLLSLLLGLGALLFSLLGLKTEGRKLAVGGTVVGLLVVFCSLGQMFGSSDRGEEDVEDVTSKVAATNVVSKKAKPAQTGNRGEYEEYMGEAASSIEEIIALSKDAKQIKGLEFCGFYTGMSYTNACLLASHYGMGDEDVWIRFNPKSGEVHQLGFSPRALGLMMNLSIDYDVAQLAIMGYLGITEWTIDAGEDVGGCYTSPERVSVELHKLEWSLGKRLALTITDEPRKQEYDKIASAFYNNKLIAEKIPELKKAGIRTQIMRLPGGVQLMLSFFGKSIVSDDQWDANKHPSIASFELTEAQWYAITGRKVPKPNGPTYPVTFVENGSGSTSDSMLWMPEAFYTTLNAMSYVQKWGIFFLEMEAGLWKDMARSPWLGKDGKKQQLTPGSIGNVAWHRGNSGGTQHPVGRKRPNIAGLYDILGNMSELCVDNGTRKCFGGDYYDLSENCTADFAIAFASERPDTPLYPRKTTIRLFGISSENLEPLARGIKLPGEVLLPMMTFKDKPSLWMGVFEVTRAQWCAVMGSIPQSEQEQFAAALGSAMTASIGGDTDHINHTKDHHPVTNVSWNDCQKFLKKLNDLPVVKEEGITFDLPTVEEWEYACRAGSTGEYGDVSRRDLGKVAWFDDETPENSDNIVRKLANRSTHEVGWKSINGYGLFDMIGNVAEWTSSNSGNLKIVCGGKGDKVLTASDCKITTRYSRDPNARGQFLGLRLVARMNLPVDKAD